MAAWRAATIARTRASCSGVRFALCSSMGTSIASGGGGPPGAPGIGGPPAGCGGAWATTTDGAARAARSRSIITMIGLGGRRMLISSLLVAALTRITDIGGQTRRRATRPGQGAHAARLLVVGRRRGDEIECDTTD